MMIKLIMSDMDGTLLDEHSDLPPRFDEVMAKLKERDILFAPASGRQYYGLVRQLKKYEDSFIFIAENGSYVVYRGQEIFSASMDRNLVGELLKITAAIPEAHAVLCGKNSAYVLSDKDEAFFTEMNKYYARYKVVASFDEVDDDIFKIAICDFSEKGAEYNAYPHFANYKGEYKAVVSGQLWLDLMNPEVNKGVAAVHIQEKFNIKPQECMAFGDYMNDAELMQSVYHSYAMENAHPEIKKIARFQAKSNGEYGVIVAIEKMLLR